MKTFLLFVSVFSSIKTMAQPDEAKLEFYHSVIQQAFDQITTPDTSWVNGFQGEISFCDLCIENNEYVKEHDSYLIAEKAACVCDRSVIFQLNIGFFRVESIQETGSQAKVRIGRYQNNAKLIKDWVYTVSLKNEK